MTFRAPPIEADGHAANCRRGPEASRANAIFARAQRFRSSPGVNLSAAEPVVAWSFFMDAKPNGTMTLDVRPLRKWKRHCIFFSTFAALKRGETFVLINDHNPLRLRTNLRDAVDDDFSWEYLQEGPEEWRILVGRT